MGWLVHTGKALLLLKIYVKVQLCFPRLEISCYAAVASKIIAMKHLEYPCLKVLFSRFRKKYDSLSFASKEMGAQADCSPPPH